MQSYFRSDVKEILCTCTKKGRKDDDQHNKEYQISDENAMPVLNTVFAMPVLNTVFVL